MLFNLKLFWDGYQLSRISILKEEAGVGESTSPNGLWQRSDFSCISSDDALEDPSKKRTAFQQLKQFHQMLFQRQIIPRENFLDIKEHKIDEKTRRRQNRIKQRNQTKIKRKYITASTFFFYFDFFAVFASQPL